MKLLSSVRAAVDDWHPALDVSARMLRFLGAEVLEPGARGADIRLYPGDVLVEDSTLRDAGIPAGCLDHAAGLIAAAVALGAPGARVSRAAVATEVYLSYALGAPPPSQPVRIGSGFVCADLGAEGDAERFATLREVTGPAADDPESLAVAAQEWRLPVTPYRRRGPAHHRSPILFREAGPTAPRRRRRWRILDLTALWAGPLTTHLLSDLGAVVWKVEPESRPDGFRSSPTPIFERLNRGKERVDLDLTRAKDLETFLRLATEADVVIDNFSPRVRANLGITYSNLVTVNPSIVSVSMPAFAPGTPEREWVAYGTGVHAVSGLGDVGGAMLAPAVSYPDPIAGMTAFLAVCAMLRAGVGGHIEIPLSTAIEPLLATDDETAITLPPPDVASLPMHGVFRG